MAKPNYQFEKRQRDLAKKAKQEEKRLHKLAVKAAAASGQPVSETAPEVEDDAAPDSEAKPEA